MLKLKILSENYTRKKTLFAEHGLSIWIEIDGLNLLFDTGQTDLFLNNANKLGIDISRADYLIISHGHYDHTGGIPAFCEINKTAPIYLHPESINKRFYEKNLDIGISWIKSENNISNNIFKRVIKTTNNITFINENIAILSEIQHKMDFEKLSNKFYILKNNILSIDNFIDEQILVINSEDGLYIILGCSHNGVINSIEYVKSFFPKEKVFCVIGGMHIEKISKNRLLKTITYFLDNKIKHIIPLHCTGIMSISEIKRSLKNNCHLLNVGDEFIF